MLGCLNYLDGSVVASLHADVGGQGHLRQTDCTRVGVVCRTSDLEGRDDGVAHVLWDCAETNVDVDQGSFVAWEPARLECDTAAVDGPLGAVVGARHTTT